VLPLIRKVPALWRVVEHRIIAEVIPVHGIDHLELYVGNAAQAYGETLHQFVQRSDYAGAFLPGFEARAERATGPDGLLVGIHHVVGNVELGDMQEWVHYYERVFGMTELIHFSDGAISTEYDGPAGAAGRPHVRHHARPLYTPPSPT
jgi:4-hydroxyphenylpyruvate dioxygenase-like putative hemolysin